MDFLLWATRSLHIFAVVVWLGGLMYQSAVMLAVAKVEGSESAPQTIHSLRRFVPFVWMCVWTVFVTGVALMFFSTKFVAFQFHDSWAILLGLKQLTFILMLFFSFGYARMLTRADEMMRKPELPVDEAKPYFRRMGQFGKINIGLGIVSLLLATGMK